MVNFAKAGDEMIGRHALVALLGIAAAGCTRAPVVAFARSEPSLTVQMPALYPETIQYDGGRDQFLVSSLRDGGVYTVDDRGRVARLVDDPRLCSVLGIALDVERGRIWVVNADLGASVKPSGAGPKNLAAVGVYDRATGKAIHYVDLAPLFAGPHLLNGIAVDGAGNAYVSDSFSPVLYKVDAQGNASVWLQSEQFVGPGINLNGVVVHPDGYLLVVKKSDGALFKVPLGNPAQFSKVDLTEKFVGGDGLLLVGKEDLVLIANQVPPVASNAAFWLSSDDGWATAKLRATEPLGDVYPTTAVRKKETIYVMHSKLNQLIQAPPNQKASLRIEATVEPIGNAKR
jgi:hypothetical protein